MMIYLNGLLSGILLSIATAAFVFRYPKRLKWLGSVMTRFAEALEPSGKPGKPVTAFTRPQVIDDVADALAGQGMKRKEAEAAAINAYGASASSEFEPVFREALKYRRSA